MALIKYCVGGAGALKACFSVAAFSWGENLSGGARAEREELARGAARFAGRGEAASKPGGSRRGGAIPSLSSPPPSPPRPHGRAFWRLGEPTRFDSSPGFAFDPLELLRFVQIISGRRAPNHPRDRAGAGKARPRLRRGGPRGRSDAIEKRDAHDKIVCGIGSGRDLPASGVRGRPFRRAACCVPPIGLRRRFEASLACLDAMSASPVEKRVSVFLRLGLKSLMFPRRLSRRFRRACRLRPGRRSLGFEAGSLRALHLRICCAQPFYGRSA